MSPYQPLRFLRLSLASALVLAVGLSASTPSRAAHPSDSPGGVVQVAPGQSEAAESDVEASRQEKPRVQESSSEKPAGEEPAAPLSAAEKRKAEMEKAARLAARRRGEYTFDDLKFDIEKDAKFERKALTKEIESFNKKTMRIRGYMFPTYQQSGIQEFVLVRDNMECCFGPGAAIFDCIRVKMAKGKTAKYSVRPVAVKGTFEIEEFRLPDGYLAAIYKITATEVK